MYHSLRYMDAAETAIFAENDDGSDRLLEPGQAEWDLALAGTYGTIAAFAPDMAEVRAAATIVVNQRAGQVRSRYITAIPGQEMIYLSKVQEAQAWLAAGSPATLTPYPLIAAEVGITAADAPGVVTTWLARAALWTQLAAAIEGARLTAVAAIAASADEAAVAAAFETFAIAMAAVP